MSRFDFCIRSWINFGWGPAETIDRWCDGSKIISLRSLHSSCGLFSWSFLSCLVLPTLSCCTIWLPSLGRSPGYNTRSRCRKANYWMIGDLIPAGSAFISCRTLFSSVDFEPGLVSCFPSMFCLNEGVCRDCSLALIFVDVANSDFLKLFLRA